MRMLVSYWDAGYVQIDVSDPANPVYITDTGFDEPDPLTGFDPPEGNAHQAEYSHDNQFFLAADEDFAPDRVTSVEIEGVGSRPASSVPGGAGGGILSDGVLNGPTDYGGYGCPGSAPVPARDSAGLPDLEPGEEAILVMQRGPEDDPSAPEESCFPGEKVQARGGRRLGRRPADEPPFRRRCRRRRAGLRLGRVHSLTVAVCTTHAAGHELFSQTPGYDLPYPDGHMPPLGTLGAAIEVVPEFDGWGYAHLYDANTSEELDAFAIPEALDERFASGFGDLSIHEFATDPARTWPTCRITRAGSGCCATAAPRGSRRWAPGSMTRAPTSGASSSSRPPDGERLIAGSDRDYGLVILRYTGPGAIGPGGVPAGPGPTGPSGAPSNRVRLRLGRYRNGRLTLIARVNGPGRLLAGLRANLPRVGAARVVRLARGSKRVRRAGRVAAHAQGVEGEAAPAGPGAAGGGPRRRHGHAQMDADGRHNTPRQPPARDREVVVGSSTLGIARAALLSGALLLVGATAASAADQRASRLPVADGPPTKAAARAAAAAAASAPSHHGPTAGHLPPRTQEMELVGRLEPKAAFGDVVPGQIADLAVHKGFAYLNSWDSADCTRGGTHVVDIRNPAAPTEVGFIPAPADYYHGEGAHAISINTPAFQGDILAVNDETYGSNILGACSDPLDQTFGGFDLYDVSNPANPQPLVQGAGDNDRGAGALPAAELLPLGLRWQDGPRAFLVATDNVEFTDIDIFDITDPRNPELIADIDAVEDFPSILERGGGQRRGGAPPRHGGQAHRRADGDAGPTTGTRATCSWT